MEKNKVYIAIFILAFVLVLLFGLSSMLSSTIKNSGSSSSNTPTPAPLPTSTRVFVPTLRPTPTGEIPREQSNSKLFTYPYPIRLRDLIVDYSVEKRHMIVYYPGKREDAQQAMTDFFKANDVQDINALYVTLDYIGLTRDPNEATPGSMLR